MRRSLFFAVAVLCSLAAWVQAEDRLPTLYRIEFRQNEEENKAKSLTVAPGDQIQVSLWGGAYPGGMFNNAKVERKGKCVNKGDVFRADQEGRVGGIEIVVELKATAVGKTEVTLTPTGEGVQPKGYQLHVDVKRE